MKKEQVTNNTLNISGNVSHSQIQQNTVNSSQKLSVDSETDYDSILGIVKEISKYEPMFEETYGQKSTQITDTLNELKEAIAKKDSPTKIQSLLTFLRDTTSQVASGIISTGILTLLSQINF